MDQYKIITPNPDYSGRAGGLRFEKGQAILSEHTLNKELGRSIEETVKMFTDDFGYQVIRLKAVDVVEEEVKPTAEPTQYIKPKAKAKPKATKRVVTGNPKEAVEVEKA